MFTKILFLIALQSVAVRPSYSQEVDQTLDPKVDPCVASLYLEHQKYPIEKHRFVPDASVLLEDPQFLFRIHNSQVIITGPVLRTLTDIRNGGGPKAAAANEFLSRYSGLLATRKSANDPMDIGNGSTLIFVRKNQTSPQDLDITDAREASLAIALEQNVKSGELPLMVLSSDLPVFHLAEEIGLKAAAYSIPEREVLPSFVDIILTPKQLVQFNHNQQLWLDNPPPHVHHNQFLRIKTDPTMADDDPKVILARFDTGQVAPDKTHSSEQTRRLMHSHRTGMILPLRFLPQVNGPLIPANAEQAVALEALFDPSVRLVWIQGLAGTGKNLITLYAGLMQSLLAQGKGPYQRILVSRSPSSMGGENWGFVPGELEDKTDHLYLPQYDNIRALGEIVRSSETYRNDPRFGELVNKPMNLFAQKSGEAKPGKIVREVLGETRGRTYTDTFWIIDEAQSLTYEQLATILTRVGKGTKLVIIGDPSQIDPPVTAETSGFLPWMRAYRGIITSAHVELTKSVRSFDAGVAAELHRQRQNRIRWGQPW